MKCSDTQHFLSRPFQDDHLRVPSIIPLFQASSVPTGDTLRGSEVGDVRGINQEDVLAKQGEEHVCDPLKINLSMFSVSASLLRTLSPSLLMQSNNV